MKISFKPIIFFIMLLPCSFSNSHELGEYHNLCSTAVDYSGCINTNLLYFDSVINPSQKTNIWKKYGNIRINWSMWMSHEGLSIAPALNKNNKSIYIAIDCNDKLINTTGENRQWKGWFSTSEPFELKLVDDFCQFKTN